MRILRALIVAAALAAAVPAYASIARAVPFEEKVQASDAIVLGRVVATESRWDPQKRWILTYSTLEVDRALKGTPAPRLTLVTPGGSVDGIRQETVGVPSLREGDERIVFVRTSTLGPTVAFMDQGVYEVRRDDRGRTLIAAAPAAAVAVDTVTGEAVAADREPIPLDAFETRVRRAMDREAIPSRMAAAPAAKETDWRADLASFAREHWKILTLAGFGILLALVPLIVKWRAGGA
ncbi:MAG: hypothetical protein ACRD2J_02095 [Thermoanaerobaculia bacterium]